MIENETHLGNEKGTRCGVAGRTVVEGMLSKLVDGGWETPVCAKCVALVIKDLTAEKVDHYETMKRWTGIADRSARAIARARKILRTPGHAAQKIDVAYGFLDWRNR